jgi:hypothetical protein
MCCWTSKGVYTVEVSGGLETLSPTLPVFFRRIFSLERLGSPSQVTKAGVVVATTA